LNHVFTGFLAIFSFVLRNLLFLTQMPADTVHYDVYYRETVLRRRPLQMHCLRNCSTWRT